FHTELCQKYGTRVVAGVSPDKGGQTHLGVPVYETVAETCRKHKVDASLIFVPAFAAKDAIFEAIEAGLKLVVVITEGIPVHDMLKVKQRLADSKTTLIGPNCPGLLVAGKAKMGIIPGILGKKGSIGVVSRSGTLTYEAANQLNQAGLGTSTVVGIGGDPVIGTDFIKILQLFDDDPETNAILMIGEIGGRAEQETATYWNTTLKRNKPLFSFIAGKTAPKGKRMGHAGAIMEGADDSAQAKSAFLASQGVVMIDELNAIGSRIAGSVKATASV
ncbi:MAG: succinate--CoA ligase subunit alpha, partial [Elusimicrobiota bacterium]